MQAITTDLNPARAEATRWLGDWHPLVRQIAPGEGVTTPVSAAPTVDSGAADDPAVLLSFLEEYKETVLLPFELPAVKQSGEHTLGNRMKELVALDASMADAPWLKSYAADSRASGRLHLERLKPLRDQRGLRRYIAAVDQGDAHGWHFLVAGAALALYALPMRQGLMDYALHTFWNVVGQASAQGLVDGGSAGHLVNHLASDLPDRIQSLFPACRVAAV